MSESTVKAELFTCNCWFHRQQQGNVFTKEEIDMIFNPIPGSGAAAGKIPFTAYIGPEGIKNPPAWKSYEVSVTYCAAVLAQVFCIRWEGKIYVGLTNMQEVRQT